MNSCSTCPSRLGHLSAPVCRVMHSHRRRMLCQGAPKIDLNTQPSDSYSPSPSAGLHKPWDRDHPRGLRSLQPSRPVLSSDIPSLTAGFSGSTTCPAFVGNLRGVRGDGAVPFKAHTSLPHGVSLTFRGSRQGGWGGRPNSPCTLLPGGNGAQPPCLRA